MLQLYGWAAGRLPEWFTERFPAEYHRKRLFDEPPGALLHAGPFEKRSGAPQVSAPERALLELLSDVGVRQPLQAGHDVAADQQVEAEGGQCALRVVSFSAAQPLHEGYVAGLYPVIMFGLPGACFGSLKRQQAGIAAPARHGCGQPDGIGAHFAQAGQ